jgi:hypothetical protein
MTKENYDKATALLEQIDKIKSLEKKVSDKYREYKEKDAELCKVLSTCTEALAVLEEINILKFKDL